MPAPGSNRARRARPASTTTRISSMVSEVSAIAVAKTTLRPCGAGAIAARWAEKSIAPNSGCRLMPAPRRGRSSASVRRISPSPGKNTSTPPWVSAMACTTRSAVACSSRAVRGRGWGSQCRSTGWLRPCEVIMGAPIIWATGAASSVADMTNKCRSSRSAPAISKHNASPRSAFSERS